MKTGSVKRIFLYLLIVIFLVADYLSLGSGSPLLEELKRSGLLSFIFPIIYILIIALAVIAVRGSLLDLSLRKYIAAAIVLALSTLYFLKISIPQGKVHLLEYELITLIIFKALEMDIKGRSLYPVTLICLLLLGVIEEVAQSLYPDRTFDVRDLKIDLISAVFMIVLIAIFRRKPHTEENSS